MHWTLGESKSNVGSISKFHPKNCRIVDETRYNMRDIVFEGSNDDRIGVEIIMCCVARKVPNVKIHASYKYTISAVDKHQASMVEERRSERKRAPPIIRKICLLSGDIWMVEWLGRSTIALLSQDSSCSFT